MIRDPERERRAEADREIGTHERATVIPVHDLEARAGVDEHVADRLKVVRLWRLRELRERVARDDAEPMQETARHFRFGQPMRSSAAEG